MLKYCILIFCTCFAIQVNSQDLNYTKHTLNELTSKKYWGRGYTKQGMEKSGNFLVKEFEKIGLQPMGTDDFKQSFSFPVNTFPGKMLVALDGIKLIPGKDFIVNNWSRGLKGQFKLQQTDSATFTNDGANIAVKIKDKLTWSVSKEVKNKTEILIQKGSINAPKKIDLNIENYFIPDFKGFNVAGVVKGTKYPDSLLILTAHYDHLGGMGNKIYFPGANDNASGVSFLLSMAKYYQQHPQEYTIGFICFAAEEAGLLGSKYFTEHPLIDLRKIKFLINLDLVGTGEGGLMVVNGTEFPQAFDSIQHINRSKNLFTPIGKRGKAANSDHYWFTEKGVPSFFIYTQGGITAYHDVFDRAKTLPFTKYEALSTLIKDFFLSFNNR